LGRGSVRGERGFYRREEEVKAERIRADKHRGVVSEFPGRRLKTRSCADMWDPLVSEEKRGGRIPVRERRKMGCGLLLLLGWKLSPWPFSHFPIYFSFLFLFFLCNFGKQLQNNFKLVLKHVKYFPSVY
jgi:hypothetical protein